MITIRVITHDNKQDINIPNHSFPLRGRMIVEYTNNEWSHREELFAPDDVTEMTFPDEGYNYDNLIQKDYIFIGAYNEDNTCVGLAILVPEFSPCMFLYDLKVNNDMRGKGVGKLLIDACYKISKEKKFTGLYTIGQDNNLNACLFYLSTGFIIGGLDTIVYRNTKQEGKANIYFYKH